MSTKKTVTNAGYKPTSDPYKFQNGSSNIILRPNQGITVNNGGNNNYGIKTSDSFLAERLKKK